MKKLGLIVAVVAIGLGLTILWPQRPSVSVPKPRVVVASSPIAKPTTRAVQTPQYHAGDTQNIGDMNVTLDRVYSVSPTVFGVDISTDYPYPLDSQFIPKGAWLYTSDGKYVHSSSVNGTHIYFTIPSNVYVDTFLFYNFKWYL